MMKILRRFAYVLMLFTVFSFLSPCLFAASGGADSYEKARQAYSALEASSDKQLYRDNWIRALDSFLAVQKKYPSHSKAPAALYMAGKTCQGLSHVSGLQQDAVRAMVIYETLASEYSKSSLADDALFLAAGIAESVLNDRSDAHRRYSEIIRLYPSGDMANDARQKLSDLAPFAVKGAGEPLAVPTGAVLTGIRHWSKPGYTRVVLDLDGPADFTANFLPASSSEKAPPRIYVDVRNATPADALPQSEEIGDGLLRRIRTGKPGGDKVRIVLDLLSFKDFKVFLLGDPSRIVIDVTGENVPELSAKEITITSRKPDANDDIVDVINDHPEDRPLRVNIPSAGQSQRLRRIVVDAGHGGKDPGAIGPSGLLEKDVTLSYARELAKNLEKGLKCEVVLTRNGDVFLPLEERTAIANKVGADLFISLHANASSSPDAYGVETYFLNLSKNDQAASVAARENGTSLTEVGNLERILFDLMANAKINESSRLAAEIQKSLVDGLGRDFSKVKDLGVRQGPFYVLLGATMPSVLVETGFISHKREESRLKNTKFKNKAVAAIVEGVRCYARALNLIASR